MHGQLFLYDTVPKNLTSCFKSVQFLNFFYARVEPVPGERCTEPKLPPHDAPSWTDDTEQVSQLFSEHGWDGLRSRFHQQGFTWQSKCQGELNVIHAVDTPIVFCGLSEDGALFADEAFSHGLATSPSRCSQSGCLCIRAFVLTVTRATYTTRRHRAVCSATHMARIASFLLRPCCSVSRKVWKWRMQVPCAMMGANQPEVSSGLGSATLLAFYASVLMRSARATSFIFRGLLLLASSMPLARRAI